MKNFYFDFTFQDVYFDDESAEVVISSLRLGDEQESGSPLTNSNWSAFEDDKVSDQHSTGALPSASPNAEGAVVVNGDGVEDKVVVRKDEDLDDTPTSSQVPDAKVEVNSADLSEDSKEAGPIANDKPPAWVEWRETPNDTEAFGSDESDAVQNNEQQVKLEDKGSGHDPYGTTEPTPSSSDNTSETALEPSSEPTNENLGSNPEPLVSGDGNASPLVTEDDETISGTESASSITEDVKDSSPVKDMVN